MRHQPTAIVRYQTKEQNYTPKYPDLTGKPNWDHMWEWLGELCQAGVPFSVTFK